MPDLFNQEEQAARYRAAEKIGIPKVAWVYKDYSQCEREGILPQIIEHINNKLSADKRSQYAMFLINNAAFPRHFFNNCPDVVLRFY